MGSGITLKKLCCPKSFTVSVRKITQEKAYQGDALPTLEFQNVSKVLHSDSPAKVPEIQSQVCPKYFA